MSDLDEVLKKEYRANIDKKVTYYIIEYYVRVFFMQRFVLLPLANKTNVTPNQVTIFGSFMAFLSLLSLFLGNHILSFVCFFAYHFCDYIDGMLARYKKMSTKFGHYLDGITDMTTFNLIFVAAYFGYEGVNIYLVLFVIFAINIHAIVATQYIVPKLRTLNSIRRFGIKKWFFDRGFLLGVDASLLGAMILLMLYTAYFNIFMLLLGCMYIFDMFYRLHELKINIIINEFQKENNEQ